MDSPVQQDVALIDNKAREKEIIELVKEKIDPSKGNMGIVLRDINDNAIRFTSKLMACKLLRKFRK
jgi:hypothetical protein